jgi:magnesium transporter
MATAIHILDEQGYRVSADLAELPALFARPQATLWIDSDANQAALEPTLRDTLGIHPLAIEDIFASRLTPKVESYADYLYIVMHAVCDDAPQHDEGRDGLQTIELDIVLGRNWVFTHHDGPNRSVDEVAADLKRNPIAMQRGAAFVAHALIDRLTDYYLPVVDRYEEEIDEVEKIIVESPTPMVLKRLFAMKRSLMRLRRISTYQRDLLMRLSRGESELIPQKALPFYRDVYDHFVRIADLADSYRELVTVSLEIYMSVVANRTNDVMKSLTLIATIMLPITFIAGVYGMNFEHMPELHWRYGYPFALLLMLAVALAFAWHFKRRRWL